MAQRTTRSRALWWGNNTLNRVTSGVARSTHGPFSLIRHVGRKSGRTYETPVILAKAPEGFIAELTYGDEVNWYRNIVAAGGAWSSTIVSSTASIRSCPSGLSAAAARSRPHSERFSKPPAAASSGFSAPTRPPCWEDEARPLAPPSRREAMPWIPSHHR